MTWCEILFLPASLRLLGKDDRSPITEVLDSIIGDPNMHGQQAPGHSCTTPPKGGSRVNLAFAVPTVKPGMVRVIEHGGGTMSRFGSGKGQTPIEGVTQKRRGVVSVGWWHLQSHLKSDSKHWKVARDLKNRPALRRASFFRIFKSRLRVGLFSCLFPLFSYPFAIHS